MRDVLLRLVSVLLVVCAGACLALLAAVVLAFTLGWVTRDQLAQIKAVLRGENLAAKVETAPPTLEGSAELLHLAEARKAKEDIDQDAKIQELEIARKKTELQALQQDAAQLLSQLEKKGQTLEAQVKEWEDRKKAYEEQVASSGLTKVKEAFEQMGARPAAQILFEYDTATTVKLLGMFKKEMRGDVLKEIRKLDDAKGPTSQGAPGRSAELLKLLEEPEPLAPMAIGAAGAPKTGTVQ